MTDEIQVGPEPDMSERTFVATMPFYGPAVRKGDVYELTTGFSTPCRVTRLRLPKGLRLMRVALTFKYSDILAWYDASDQTYMAYAAKNQDSLICRFGKLVGPVSAGSVPGGWKTLRLLPGEGNSISLLLVNESEDDLRAEGVFSLEHAPLVSAAQEEV